MKANTRIQTLLPYLVHFITTAVRFSILNSSLKVSLPIVDASKQIAFISSVEKWTFFLLQIQTLFEDITKLLRVFDLIKALTENKHLHLEPYVSEIALYDTSTWIKERWPIQFQLAEPSKGLCDVTIFIYCIGRSTSPSSHVLSYWKTCL